MRIGILFHNEKQQPLHLAVTQALRVFREAEHTNGYEPAEIRLNPGQMPKDGELDIELEILPDERVKPGYIRVCTRPCLTVELAMEADTLIEV